MMKYMTEKEVFSRNTIDLEFCTLLEEEGKLSLDDLNDLIPGYIHLNNRQTLGMEYLSESGLEKFQKTLAEIQQEGRDFINRITDLKSQHIFNTSLIQFSLCGDRHGTMSFIQRARYTEKIRVSSLLYNDEVLQRRPEFDFLLPAVADVEDELLFKGNRGRTV